MSSSGILAPRDEAKELRRVWWAIGLGTAVQVVAFGSLVLAMLAAVSEEELASGPAFALGFSMVPIWCVVVAFVSGHDRAPMAALKGMFVWVVIALPMVLINPIVGLAVGFGAAGAFLLRSTALRPGRARAIAVVGLGLYVALLLYILPQAALFGGAVAPLLVLRAADYLSERSEAKA